MFFVCFLFHLQIHAQTVDVIIDSNLFDPNRGVNMSEQAVQAQEETLPRDLPLLDGIVVIGDYKRAIFRYKNEETRKLENKIVRIGEDVGDARLTEIRQKEVSIVFQGTQYKLTVDSKERDKDAPGGQSQTTVSRNPSASGPEVIHRNIAVPQQKATLVPTGRNSNVPANRPKNSSIGNSGGRTPFGTRRPVNSNKKANEKKKNQKRSPF